MADREFLRFISNQENINYEKVLSEIKNIAFVSSSRIGRVVDEEDVKEISSCFIAYLWEEKCKGNFPMDEEAAFAKLKRFIYDLCSTGRVVSGFDEKIESDLLSYTPKKEISKDVFLSEIEKINIPKKIKDVYSNIVENTDYETLIELSEKDNFLGNLLVSFLMRPHGKVKYLDDDESYNLFKIKEKDEELYLACLVVKVGKPWPYCSFVLWGQNLFSGLLSFMGNVLIPSYKKYFRNLFLSIKIFMSIESYKNSCDEFDAIKKTSRRFSIRVRDVVYKYNKIKRILLKYEQISDFYALELQNNYKELFSEENQQLSLFDLKEEVNV